MLSGWHIGFSKEELAFELVRRFGWDESRSYMLCTPLTNEKMADILGEMDRLRKLLRECQVPDGRSCAVCGDNGHQAAECHHIDLVATGSPSGALGPERNVPIGIRRALDEIEETVCERIATDGRGQFATMLDDMADIIGSEDVLLIRQAIADREFAEIRDTFRYLGASCVLMIVCLAEISMRQGAKYEG